MNKYCYRLSDGERCRYFIYGVDKAPEWYKNFLFRSYYDGYYYVFINTPKEENFKILSPEEFNKLYSLEIKKDEDIVKKDTVKYIRYRFGDYKELIGKLVRRKVEEDRVGIIVGVDLDNVIIGSIGCISFDDFYNNYVFEDGSACVKMVGVTPPANDIGKNDGDSTSTVILNNLVSASISDFNKAQDWYMNLPQDVKSYLSNKYKGNTGVVNIYTQEILNNK